MTTRQIPRNEWIAYLTTFSANNQTRPVNIDLESNELGPQRLVEGRPFIAAEADTGGRENVITLIAGDPEGGEPEALTHEVTDPNAVWVKADDEGQIEALDIESPDGRTIVQFLSRAA